MLFMKRIAIFASGSGTNAENIIEKFKKNDQIKIALILSNKKNAFVLERAKRLMIPFRTFSRHEFYHSNNIVELLQLERIDLIVLSGFLWLIPDNLIFAFENRIINIHPALLPNYGGKGMYGHLVHEAVVANHETETGITIHYVNEKYDEGNIIFQVKCQILPDDTPEKVADKVHQLEYLYFPEIIEKVLTGIP
jgi:phosphoribosylglycinamide formyltransferase-1